MSGAIAPPMARYQRLKRLFSGDTESFVALLAVGVLGSSFFKLEWWHQVLIGQTEPITPSVLGLTLLLFALAWRSLLRRRFVWADPAQLTWSDFSIPGRVRSLNARLGGGWLWRLLVLGYASALLELVYAVSLSTWLAGACVLAGSAALAFTSARHPDGDRPAESAGAFLLAGIGVLEVVLAPPTAWLLALTAMMFAVAGFRLPGSGGPLRPAVATETNRAALVNGWLERAVRTTSITFLDLMMLLPPSRPMRGWKLRGATALRLAWVGALGRARYAGTATLLALTIAVAYRALPALSTVVLAGVGAYVALMPFAAGIGELWRSPGKRRWLDASDLELRCWHGLVLFGFACAWSETLFGIAALLGVEMSWTTWLAVPLAVGAVLRTATRPVVTYDNLGVVETGVGMMPVRLIKQFVRGPDVGLLGLGLLFVLPGPAAIAATIVLTGFCLLR